MISAQIIPQAGERIGVVCGPGEFPRGNMGLVLCVVTDRWGTHAVVLMDSGETKTCHGMNRGPGIGWHYIK
jgi:hypothetical protein